MSKTGGFSTGLSAATRRAFNFLRGQIDGVGERVDTLEDGSFRIKLTQNTKCLVARVRYDVGTHSFVIGDYPGATEIHVRMTGGGGGGGGAQAVDGSNVSAGGGGGAAASAEFVVPVASLSASESITVGAGGAGGAGAANGSDGTDTTGFGWTMEGGFGGLMFAGSSADFRAMRGGVGGTVTAGTGTALNSTDGAWGGVTQAWAFQRPAGGNGGDSMLGLGGRGANAITASGQDGAGGYGNGSGGGGGANRPGQATDRNGGTGADGIVLIEVWATSRTIEVPRAFEDAVASVGPQLRFPFRNPDNVLEDLGSAGWTITDLVQNPPVSVETFPALLEAPGLQWGTAMAAGGQQVVGGNAIESGTAIAYSCSFLVYLSGTHGTTTRGLHSLGGTTKWVGVYLDGWTLRATVAANAGSTTAIALEHELPGPGAYVIGFRKGALADRTLDLFVDGALVASGLASEDIAHGTGDPWWLGFNGRDENSSTFNTWMNAGEAWMAEYVASKAAWTDDDFASLASALLDPYS